MSSEARPRTPGTGGASAWWSLALGPAVIWAAHFAASYALLARACHTGGGWGSWGVAALTVPAAAAIVGLGVRARRGIGRAVDAPEATGHDRRLLARVAAVAAPVFLAGVILTASSPLLLPTCAALAR